MIFGLASVAIGAAAWLMYLWLAKHERIPRDDRPVGIAALVGGVLGIVSLFFGFWPAVLGLIGVALSAEFVVNAIVARSLRAKLTVEVGDRLPPFVAFS